MVIKTPTKWWEGGISPTTPVKWWEQPMFTTATQTTTPTTQPVPTDTFGVSAAGLKAKFMDTGTEKEGVAEPPPETKFKTTFRPVPWIPIEITIGADEGKWGDVLDALYLGASRFWHGTKQYLTSELPQYLLQTFKGLAEGEIPITGVPGLLQVRPPWAKEEKIPEPVREFTQNTLNKLQTDYAEREVQLDKWFESHPELKPRKEWEAGTIETIKGNPGILLDPAYIAYLAAESAVFTGTFLASTIGVTAITKNPVLGLMAGVAMTTPAQSHDLYQDLIAAGATPEQAAELSIPIGAVISSVEILGGMQVLRAIAPQFFRSLRRNITREIARRTFRSLLRKGITTVAKIEIAETIEEIIQGVIQDATVKTIDENRSLLADIPETTVRTLLATLPLAIFGGGQYTNHLYKNMSPEQKGQVESDRGELESQGISPEEAELIAINNLQETPEGKKVVDETISRIDWETVSMAEWETVTGLPEGVKPFDVVVEQQIIVGGRVKPEPVSRTYRINAKTEAQARKAIKDAGIKGNIVEVTPRVTEVTPEVTKPVEVTAPIIEPEFLSIPETLPTTPPPVTPIDTTLGRTDSEWTGFMKDLQDANILADVAFRPDVLRRLVPRIPVLRNIFGVMAPNVVANTPAGKYIVSKATLMDEGGQKSQGVIAHLQEVGSQNKIFGAETAEHTIKSGPLKGYSVGYIAEHRARFEAKLTPEQRLWLDRANKIEQSITEFLINHGIEINKVSLEEGGQFATRRVYARVLGDGTTLEVGFVGAAPGRPGARLPTEKHRIFKDEAEAIKNGYRYIPYEEALYLRLTGAYRRIANQKAADWLLTQVEWRTTGAPEELILAAESARLKLRHSQTLLAALNRAVRGERIPSVTINSIARSYPDQAQQLKALIPRIQAGETTARDVQRLTRTAKGLISTNEMMYANAVSQRARAREAAMTVKVGETMIPAPAFSGKILTGPDAKETMQTVMDSFRPQFSKVLGEVNKFNAVVRYYMLAGDISYPNIQLIFMMGENPKAFTQAMTGAIHSILDPKFHDSQIAKFKDVIDRHPNMILSIRGRTEMTEAMAKGGWLSGETNLFPQGEKYQKSLGLLIPRAMGKGMGKLLTPFQRGMEGGLDLAGIYLALANEHMATTPAEIADLDQWINEFRGLTSSSRMGVTALQRQRERGAVLAPQYNRAIASWLWSLTRGGLRGHLARRSLARGMVPIVIMAILISLLRGEDKDEIIEHLNPNSSKFLTWDMAGQQVGPGSKVRSLLKLLAQSASNPDDLLEFSMNNPALRFARGNASPAVSSGIDLLTGKSYIGDPTRDGLLSFSKEILGGNLLPIWVQSTLLEGGNAGGRTVRGLAEFFGWRAYPEPLWNEVGRLKDRYAQQDFRKAWEDLNREQIDTVRVNHPDLVELEEKARLEQAKRGNEFEHAFYLIREEAVKERNDALENAATLLLDGTLTKYDYDKERGYARPYYSGGMAALYGLRDRLDPKAINDIQEWLNVNQKPQDKAFDAYQ